MFTFNHHGKTLAPWVLILEQESYLPYVRKGDKDFANYRPISLISLHNGYFRNLKTNQLLIKKELYYKHFLLYMTSISSTCSHFLHEI